MGAVAPAIAFDVTQELVGASGVIQWADLLDRVMSAYIGTPRKQPLADVRTDGDDVNSMNSRLWVFAFRGSRLGNPLLS